MNNPLEKELNITITRSELSQIVSSLMLNVEIMNEQLENENDQFKEIMKQQIEKVKSIGRKLNPILQEEMKLVREERKENI